ncbi:zinc-binding alcohol dehydrogenase family protein [Nocardia sp. NPDC088792]|uniref:quinone oxidoreductase family protein n=1 Tax=Nocardia sp. NPDC088792 TaxID=3364332 RepID=UPI0037F87D20
MRKISFTGRPELTTAEQPVPGPGQLLIRIELTGVGLGLVRMINAGNGVDGGEIAGTVVAAGADVAEWAGKRVCGLVFEGAFAEYALAVPQLLTEIPDGVDAADALALARGGLIAQGLVRTARVARGESVLITGAASGVGHLAVQAAKALGASRVVAVVSNSDKAEFLRDCGADTVVTYDEPWGDPVDVVLDGVGGDLVQRGVDALGTQGRLLAFSAGGGAVDANSLLAGLKTVTGFSMGLLSRTRADLLVAWRAELWELLAAGRIRPRTTVLPVGEIESAIEIVASRRNLGRVAVRIA